MDSAYVRLKILDIFPEVPCMALLAWGFLYLLILGGFTFCYLVLCYLFIQDNDDGAALVEVQDMPSTGTARCDGATECEELVSVLAHLPFQCCA